MPLDTKLFNCDMSATPSHYGGEETYAQKILFLAETVQVSSAEWQRSKVLVDDVEELVCRCNSQWDIRGV
jgi:hypothetical protein